MTNTTIVLFDGAPVAIMADEQAPTSTTRVDTELLALAKIVCAHTRLSNGKQLKLGDYLDQVLRPRILKDHAAVMERIKADGDSKGQGKGKRGGS